MEPEPGAMIAEKYRVERMIARGACGTVYEGEHQELGKRVAIKLIAEDLARSEEVAVRFRQEARAAALVRSDHIVQVFDVGTDERFGLYMVMELLAGEDLEMRLRRVKQLEIELAVDIATQAARGLAKAHAAGVVHRDLKPANVFLSTRDDGTMLVKLVDFGISKLLRDDRRRGGGAQTRSGTAVGTPQYMSPEQAQGLAVDHRTDVWALGAVLFEMLAGRPAYQEHEAYEQTIIAIVRDDTPKLGEVAPWVPKALSDVVAGALEHDVEKRISDATTFAELLAAAMANDPPLIELGPADEPEASHERAPIDPTDPAGPIDPGDQTDQTSAKIVVAPALPRRGGVLRTLVVLFAIVGVLAIVGGVIGRHGEKDDAAANQPPPVEPAPSASVSASTSASTKPRPKVGTHPVVKPKTKPSASASVSSAGAPSSSKSFGAAGLASTY